MKIIHIESGLGNQMLSYSEYIAVKMMNPNDKCYIETIIYDIPECNDTICQWNGYELNRIFGINVPNIKELFGEEEWEQIINEIRNTQFWKKNWNYPIYFTEVLNRHGLELENIRGNFEEVSFAAKFNLDEKSIKYKIKHSSLYYYGKLIFYNLTKSRRIQAEKDNLLYIVSDKNLFTGQRLSLKYKGNEIEKIDGEIRKTFQFPIVTDKKNLELINTIKSTNSVAIHARRGDMLSANGYCYKFGYFSRAVKYIRKHVNNPVFIFFCDAGSIEWCKKNEKIFALNLKKDTVFFVDWNKGNESYRDMQLMSLCKHNIITNSSFGWWAAYLNENIDKITCSPEIAINTTNHF